jgi:chemotaxis protein CheZ
MKSAASRKSSRAAVRPAPGKTSGYADVISLATSTANSLDAVLRKIDGDVFGELKAIARQIDILRKEIGRLQPTKMHHESIPAAGQELDAIVTATESASNRILECAEQVMDADASNPARYKAFVEARMLTVFEACEFQDLTGQRIAKVIDTLKQIETRVARFANAEREQESTRSSSRARPPRAKSNSQAAIDKILGKRKPRRKPR